MLETFFDFLRDRNGGQHFSLELKHEISEYFEHRWEFDKNAAIDDPHELELLQQLPIWVQDDIYTDFLWRLFLQKFNGFFRIVNGSKFGVSKYTIEGKVCDRTFYNWNDQPYREFMTSIL